MLFLAPQVITLIENTVTAIQNKLADAGAMVEEGAATEAGQFVARATAALGEYGGGMVADMEASAQLLALLGEATAVLASL
jgi:hypothetical protein